MLTRDDFALIRWFDKRYVRRHRWHMVLATACLFISTAATTALIWIIQPALDEGFVRQNQEIIWLIPFAVLAMSAINGIATYAHGLLSDRINQAIMTALQNDLYDRYLEADIATINRTHSGDVLTVGMQYTAMAVGTVAGLGITMFRDLLLCLSMFAVMLMRDWQLCIIALVVTPLMAIGIRTISRKLKSSTRLLMDVMQQTGRSLTEVFAAMRTVKLEGTESVEVARFEAATRERRRLAMRQSRVASISTPVNEIVGGLAIAGVLLYAALRTYAGETSPGTLASFIGALVVAHQPLKRLARTLAGLTQGLMAVRAIKTTLDLKPAIVDAPDAEPLELRDGRVVFENVAFSYRGDGPPTLQNVTFSAERGRVVALVGPSGGGKTTIISLIPRLYDVGSGRIAIDGMDIRQVRLVSLRAAIAMVTQDTFMFDATIGENIAFGRPGATIEQIQQAARAAEIDEFVQSLPEGYATRVGEGGVLLSGGQRQRIAIARAVLKDAPILLLDEATSALDYETEKAIKATLKRIMCDRTTIIVAHRLATIADADLICVIVDGRVAESGTHAELLARRGYYAGLYAAQGGPEDAAAVNSREMTATIATQIA